VTNCQCNLDAAFQELSDNSPPEQQPVLDWRIQAELQMDHPTLWKFIDGLKKVQKGRDLFHEQLVAGHAPPRKLRRYRLCDERIQRIVPSYANYGIMDYLLGLVHNFEMN